MDILLKELKGFDAWNFTSSVEMLDSYKSTNPFKTAVIKRKVMKISVLAEELLIDIDGQLMWDHIEMLEDEGYNVFPYEQDRFGWLIGCIKSSKGIITFG